MIIPKNAPMGTYLIGLINPIEALGSVVNFGLVVNTVVTLSVDERGGNVTLSSGSGRGGRVILSRSGNHGGKPLVAFSGITKFGVLASEEDGIVVVIDDKE